MALVDQNSPLQILIKKYCQSSPVAEDLPVELGPECGAFPLRCAAAWIRLFSGDQPVMSVSHVARAAIAPATRAHPGPSWLPGAKLCGA
jgi:hypothetical protein